MVVWRRVVFPPSPPSWVIVVVVLPWSSRRRRDLDRRGDGDHLRVEVDGLPRAG